jgi:UDP:flavonoid glycosyltransferase YjiC (YdhE family)
MFGLGRRPILITGGTSMWTRARQFYEVAAHACSGLGLTGILVCRHRELLPKAESPGIVHFAELPLNVVLPHVSVVIHHGGSGTMIQAMKSGTPQLIMPFGADRQDNGLRVEQLGIGTRIPSIAWNIPNIHKKLESLIDNDMMKPQLDAIKTAVRESAEPDTGYGVIEAMARQQPYP